MEHVASSPSRRKSFDGPTVRWRGIDLTIDLRDLTVAEVEVGSFSLFVEEHGLPCSNARAWDIVVASDDPELTRLVLAVERDTEHAEETAPERAAEGSL